MSTTTERLILGDDRVRLCFTLPSLPENAETPLRKGFAAYYGGMRRGFVSFAKDRLLRRSKNASLPIGAVLRAVPCHENAHVLSLYVDAAVTVDGCRRVSRLPQLWDKKSGALVRTERLFAGRRLRALLPLIERGALRRAESAGVPLYSDWRLRLRRGFSARQLYLSPRGAVFFFPALLLGERNEIFTSPVSAKELAPFLKAGEAERLWGALEKEA